MTSESSDDSPIMADNSHTAAHEILRTPPAPTRGAPAGTADVFSMDFSPAITRNSSSKTTCRYVTKPGDTPNGTD